MTLPDLDEVTNMLRELSVEATRAGLPTAHVMKIADVVDVVIPLLEAARLKGTKR